MSVERVDQKEEKSQKDKYYLDGTSLNHSKQVRTACRAWVEVPMYPGEYGSSRTIDVVIPLGEMNHQSTRALELQGYAPKSGEVTQCGFRFRLVGYKV